MSFDDNTYNPGKQLLIRYQESKHETALFMKVGTNVIFTQMSAKSGIKKLDKKRWKLR